MPKRRAGSNPVPGTTSGLAVGVARLDLFIEIDQALLSGKKKNPALTKFQVGSTQGERNHISRRRGVASLCHASLHETNCYRAALRTRCGCPGDLRLYSV
jgi:hypothetical protein